MIHSGNKMSSILVFATASATPSRALNPFSARGALPPSCITCSWSTCEGSTALCVAARVLLISSHMRSVLAFGCHR